MRPLPLALVLTGIAATVLGTNACSVIGLSSSSCGDGPEPKEVEIPRDQACEARIGDTQLDCRKVGCEEHRDCAPLSNNASVRIPVDGGGGDAGLGECAYPATVTVRCQTQTICEGRGTEGIPSVELPANATIAEYLVAAHRLEAISVQAFRRLHAELRAHDAPADLLARLDTAAREEVRHTELVYKLATHYGVEPSYSAAPIAGFDSPRSLHAIAIENAVEGCVRETYGAVLALVRAARAEDPHVRTTMTSIAIDECQHAETSAALARWLDTRLDDDERAAVRAAAKTAFAALVSEADAAPTEAVSSALGVATATERKRILGLLDENGLLPSS